MKIFMSKDWYTSALGKVEHFMLTTPSCESKAPKDWDKMEVNWNTFIYYKKFDDQKTRNDAKDFCRTQGRIYFDSNTGEAWKIQRIPFHRSQHRHPLTITRAGDPKINIWHSHANVSQFPV